MRSKVFLIILVVALLISGHFLLSDNSDGRSQIRQIHVVGSSTVYPFSATVAERFGRLSTFKTPVIESTGSGGGFKLFCGGVGENRPDVVNASRRIKQSEVENCKKHGITGIIEVPIGFDGIVVANKKNQPRLNLTKRQIFLALAKQIPQGGKLILNPHERWSDIDPSFPDIKIKVFGPPPTSGTRDAFVETAMEGGCETFDLLKEIKKDSKKTYKTICHSLREDGAFIEMGENDNFIVLKLTKIDDAFGIFGFSTLDQNLDIVQGSLIDNVEPTFENISDGTYGISRLLYFYIKGEHVGKIPGIVEYAALFIKEEAIGIFGYLSDKGLIPMSEEEQKLVRENIVNLTPLEL